MQVAHGNAKMTHTFCLIDLDDTGEAALVKQIGKHAADLGTNATCWSKRFVLDDRNKNLGSWN